MKLIKSASGKTTIKMSKSEWTDMGKKAGWMDNVKDVFRDEKEDSTDWNKVVERPSQGMDANIDDWMSQIQNLKRNLEAYNNVLLNHGGWGGPTDFSSEIEFIETNFRTYKEDVKYDGDKAKKKFESLLSGFFKKWGPAIQKIQSGQL